MCHTFFTDKCSIPSCIFFYYLAIATLSTSTKFMNHHIVIFHCKNQSLNSKKISKFSINIFLHFEFEWFKKNRLNILNGLKFNWKIIAYKNTFTIFWEYILLICQNTKMRHPNESYWNTKLCCLCICETSKAKQSTLFQILSRL